MRPPEPKTVCAEFITRDGGMQYRVVDMPLHRFMRLPLRSRVLAGTQASGTEEVTEFREYELTTADDSLLTYREI